MLNYGFSVCGSSLVLISKFSREFMGPNCNRSVSLNGQLSGINIGYVSQHELVIVCRVCRRRFFVSRPSDLTLLRSGEESSSND